MIHLRLPFPPSLNGNQRGAGRWRHDTPQYKAWKQEAFLCLLGKPKLAGAFHVHISIDQPDQRRRDLDNLIKPILDALQSSKVIENDALCERLTVEWSGTIVKPAHAHITLQPAHEARPALRAVA